VFIGVNAYRFINLSDLYLYLGAVGPPHLRMRETSANKQISIYQSIYQSIDLYRSIYLCLCLCVSTYLPICHLSIYMYVCIYLFICIYMNIYIYNMYRVDEACTYIYIYIYIIYIYIAAVESPHLRTRRHMCRYINIYLSIYIYVYIYISPSG